MLLPRYLSHSKEKKIFFHSREKEKVMLIMWWIDLMMFYKVRTEETRWNKKYI